MVNRLVWMGLQEYERIWWMRLGEIEEVNGTSISFIERVIPEAQKAIEGAKVDIELPEEMDHTHNSFIECSMEAGILLSGNGALRTIEAPSVPSG